MPNPVKVAEVGAELIEKLSPGALAEAKRAVARIAEELSLKDLATIAKSEVAQAVSPESAASGAVIRAGALFANQGELGTVRLASLFEHNPRAQARLKELPDWFHRQALQFVRLDPFQHLPLLERQLTGITPSHILIHSERLGDLAVLEKALDAKVVNAVLAHEAEGTPLLHGVHTAIQTPKGKELVERLVEEGAPASFFTHRHLSAQQRLEELLGKDSPTMRRLLDLVAHSGLDLANAAELNDARVIERLLTHQNPAGMLNASHFKRFADSLKIAQTSGPVADVIEEAATLSVSHGLKIERLNSFINGDGARTALVAGEIERGTTVARLQNSSWLPGLELVSKQLGSDRSLLRQAVSYADQNRLSLWQLGTYISGNPAERLPVVRKLIGDGQPERTSDLVRLSMFPQSTAQRIVDATASGVVRVEQVVAHARDLEHGANFVEVASRQVQQGGALTPESVAQWAQEARSSAPTASPFVAREPDKQRARLTAFAGTNVGKLASNIKEVTNVILERFSPDRTIVVLGRDMNFFTPLLRAHGRKTIDFHLSRLQHSDASAAARWHEEVPPNAVVIDSGVLGSMHTIIKGFDPTVEPYLIRSHSKYPQLQAKMELGVGDFESFPKLTGRCSGYRPTGAAICRLRSTDSYDMRQPSVTAAEWNRALLQELGLSDWYVWRYRTFTAVPRSERIGISQPERIQQYLQSIAELRAQSGR